MDSIEKLRRPAVWAFTVLVLIAVFIIGTRSDLSSKLSAKESALDQVNRMSSCRERVLNTLKPDHVDLQTLGSIHGLCYAQINEEDILADFSIRKSALLIQQVQTPVMLWLVVAITLS